MLAKLERKPGKMEAGVQVPSSHPGNTAQENGQNCLNGEAKQRRTGTEVSVPAHHTHAHIQEMARLWGVKLMPNTRWLETGKSKPSFKGKWLSLHPL